MHFIYGIKSQLKEKIYIGQTKNIEERLFAHNNGRVKSTKAHGPWHLIAVEKVDNREKATWIEKRLKNSHGMRLRWLKKNGL